MYTRDLGGHSGCKVELCESDDFGTFVRKTAGSIDYNTRLIAQANKQQQFISDVIRTPEIVRTGFTKEGMYYFDMEYIHGITLAEFMKTVEVGKIRDIVEKITSQILRGGANCDDDVEECLFFDKIATLKYRLLPLKEKVIDEGISLLESHSWSRFYRSPCHGDLTLENIILKNDQIYFIDFLDSFYDSWIMDLSTILQDVQMLWAYRHQQKIEMNTLIRLIIFRDILLDEVKKVMGEDVIELYYALLLKLLRIYPYVQDEETFLFLNSKVKLVLDIIRG